MASSFLPSILANARQVLGSVRRSAVSPSSSSDPHSSILKDLKKLDRTLQRIQAVIHDAEEREIREEAIKLWVKELKEVAYDAEDVLDEHHYEELRAQAEGRASRKRKRVEGDDEEEALYSVGLRKFVLAGVGPLGCIPNQRASGLAPADRCVDQVNQMVGLFNVGLRSLVKQLNTHHPGAIFVYGNTYGVLGNILNNPSTYGFTVVERGCCGLGRFQGQITCLPFCLNRSQHIFWDAFHPTQAVNLILGQRAFTGPPNDMYPVNVQQLAQL